MNFEKEKSTRASLESGGRKGTRMRNDDTHLLASGDIQNIGYWYTMCADADFLSLGDLKLNRKGTLSLFLTRTTNNNSGLSA